MSDLSPKIRFKGFTEEWEQHKFGEFGTISMNKRVFKSQTSEQGDIPFYKIGTFGGTADAYITKELFEEYKMKYPYPNKGDILVSASGSIGKTVEYTGELAYFQDSNIVWLNHAESLNNSFLKQLYLIVKWNGLEGSTIKRLYNSNFLDTDICVPNLIEQQLLGEYFDKIDNLITLHQRKYDKLLRMKKSLLEKLFPNNGETIPSIRFKGFAKDWEQYKYEEIGCSLTGGNLSYNDLKEEGKYKCVLYGELYTRYDTIINDIVNRTNKEGITIKNNDILFPQSTTVDAISLISPACMNEKSAQTAGVFVIRPNNNIDGNFITYYTRGNTSQKYKLSTKAQGLTIIHLYYQSIKDETILIPSLEEQKKISTLFMKLDSLIRLYQQKVETLKKLKSSLLNQMFAQ